MIPTSVKASMSPGYTVRPFPSMTHVSSGIGASLATDLITPRATITVTFSRRGPETGTTVAPRMAKYCGSPPCAAIRGASASERARMETTLQAKRTLRPNKELIPQLLTWIAAAGSDSTEHRASRRTRLVGSHRGVKHIHGLAGEAGERKVTGKRRGKGRKQNEAIRSRSALLR